MAKTLKEKVKTPKEKTLTDRVFEIIPHDGETISGGDVKKELGLTNKEYKEAKQDLKSLGLIELGRGRGGTLRRTGKQPPKQKTKEQKQKEQLEFAREMKAAQTREQKRNQKIHDAAMKIAEEEFPDALKLEVQVWTEWGECFIYPWYEEQDGVRRARARRVVVDIG